MDMDEFDVGAYQLNWEGIANEKNNLAVTRLLAKQLMENPYIVVGTFIKEMSDSDLYALNAKLDTDNEDKYNDLLLMSEMLATAEGCPQCKTVDEWQERANYLATLLTIESLNRKGLVKAYHENMSFHDDMGDKMIVEKL